MQIRHNIWVTRAFFLERFVACFVVSFIYFIVASLVQAIQVNILGPSTFNYIISGLSSLLVAVPIASYLGHLILVIIRCCHVSALASVKTIDKLGLSALETGNLVFKKHLTSFGMVYGASYVIKKVGTTADDKLWELLDGLPMVDVLKRVCNLSLVKRVARGVYTTAFDAVVYYIVRFTKAGISDDGEVILPALKKYLYALPKIAKTSVPSFLLAYLLPTVVNWFVAIMLLLTNGIVAGIYQSVLIWPIFFILRKCIFEPVVTVALLTTYSTVCKDEDLEDSKTKVVVDAILEAAGLEDLLDDVNISSGKEQGEQEGQKEEEDNSADGEQGEEATGDSQGENEGSAGAKEENEGAEKEDDVEARFRAIGGIPLAAQGVQFPFLTKKLDEEDVDFSSISSLEEDDDEDEAGDRRDSTRGGFGMGLSAEDSKAINEAMRRSITGVSSPFGVKAEDLSAEDLSEDEDAPAILDATRLSSLGEKFKTDSGDISGEFD